MAAKPTWTEAQIMQVPPDLASRLSAAALLREQSPEAILREAISRWIETNAAASGAMDRTERKDFLPQPLRFSVYE